MANSCARVTEGGWRATDVSWSAVTQGTAHSVQPGRNQLACSAAAVHSERGPGERAKSFPCEQSLRRRHPHWQPTTIFPRWPQMGRPCVEGWGRSMQCWSPHKPHERVVFTRTHTFTHTQVHTHTHTHTHTHSLTHTHTHTERVRWQGTQAFVYLGAPWMGPWGRSCGVLHCVRMEIEDPDTGGHCRATGHRTHGWLQLVGS